jgi:hypothetical protein
VFTLNFLVLSTSYRGARLSPLVTICEYITLSVIKSSRYQVSGGGMVNP